MYFKGVRWVNIVMFPSGQPEATQHCFQEHMPSGSFVTLPLLFIELFHLCIRFHYLQVKLMYASVVVILAFSVFF